MNARYQVSSWFAGGVCAVIVMLGLGVTSAPAAHALGDLDQTVTGIAPNTTGVNSNQTIGQVFTAGRSGLLDRVSLDLRKTGTPGVLNVSLFEVTNGYPAGTALATQAVAAASVSSSFSLVVVDFTSPATVVSGTQYALVLEAPTSTYTYGFMGMPASGGDFAWGAENNPLATGFAVFYVGSSWSNSSGDFRFSTYVTAAAPPTPPAQNSPALEAAPLAATADPGGQLAQTGWSEQFTPFVALAFLGGGVWAFVLRRRVQARHES